MGKWGLAYRDDQDVVMTGSSKRALVEVLRATREEPLRVVRSQAGLYLVYAMKTVTGVYGAQVEVLSGPWWLIGTRAALEARGREWPRAKRENAGKTGS